MKNAYKVKNTLAGFAAGFAAIALAIVLGTLSVTGCSSPVDPPKSATVSLPTGGDSGNGGNSGNPAVINIAAIGGVTAPVTGGTPVIAITETAQYTGTVTWNGNPSSFADNTSYIATITLTAKTGYTLQGVGANFFTVTGAILASNNANSGVVTAVFPQTGGTADNPVVITIAAIQGITIPATGGTPVTSITENGQYSGTVTWSPNHPTFAVNTPYTATINLTAKTGYTLQGVGANFFTVAGAASVSNAANSGVITAVFPATVPIKITSVNISIIAPVKGATPDTTADVSDDVENFTMSAVSWSPNNNPFLGDTVYTASVTLTANSDYTFADLTSATINGQNVVVSNNTGSTVTLTHTFPATNEKTVSGIAIKTQPSKLTYTHGDTLDLSGLVVTLTYDDTITEDVAAAQFTAKNVTANPATGNIVSYSTHNGQSITITYGSLTKDTNNLTVNKATPTAADFTISGTGTFTYDGSTRAVTVMHKEGKSDGAITVKYNGGTTAPSAAGTYTVTFDVAEAENFNAASGLSAGMLTINKATFTSAPALVLTAGNGSLGYTWTASNPTADSYDIYWKAGSGLTADNVKTGTKITGAASGGEITGLTNGTAYSALVTANKANYNSVDSDVVTVVTKVDAATPVISAQPQGGTFFKIGTLSVTANVTDGGTLTYQWYRNTANNTTGGTVITGATGSSYTLSDAGTYYYYVIVTNTITDNGDGGAKTAQTTSNMAVVTIELVLAEWARTVTVGNNFSRFYAVVVDSSGNVYAAGYQYGNGTYTYGTGVSVQGSNRDGTNVVLVKYNSSGTAQWARTVSEGYYNSIFYAVAVDSSGNVYAAGYQTGSGNYTYGTGISLEGRSGSSRVVLVKYDSNGTTLWARTDSAGSGDSDFFAVAVDSSGNVYAAGQQYGTGTYTYDVGVVARGNADGNNVVLVKYNSDGTALWARSVTVSQINSTSSHFNAVTVDLSGNVYAAGEQWGSSFTYGTGISTQGNSAVLVKYNSDGTALWAQTVTASQINNRQTAFHAVAVDYFNNVYVAGYQEGTNTYTYGSGVFAQGTNNSNNTNMDQYGGHNVVLVKYNSSGTAQWARTVSTGNNASHFNAISVDLSGNVYAAGWQRRADAYTYSTEVSAQGTNNAYNTTMNQYGHNVVLVKYNSSGTALWARSVSTGNNESAFNAVAADSSGNVYAVGYQRGNGIYTYGTGVSAQGTCSSSSSSSSNGNAVLVKYKE